MSTIIVIISFSVIEGTTWAARSLHLWAYYLKDPCPLLHMLCSCILSEAISELYWYCLTKATIRSFQEWTREGSKLVYQVTAALVRLSWKKCISSFPSFAYAPIFRQYIFRWFSGQVVPLYLSNSGTMNLGMTMFGYKERLFYISKGIISASFNDPVPFL